MPSSYADHIRDWESLETAVTDHVDQLGGYEEHLSELLEVRNEVKSVKARPQPVHIRMQVQLRRRDRPVAEKKLNLANVHALLQQAREVQGRTPGSAGILPAPGSASNGRFRVRGRCRRRSRRS